jgi:NAD(P)-dependent dehydrogenase (short-subunit alcohol dehydrogenase family)
MLTIPQPTPFADLLSLRGKCAIVTGGSRGLGEATVHRLAAAGASVVFTGRGADALRHVQDDVALGGGTAVGVQADISSLDDSKRVIGIATERFGSVDVLVNNAALYTGSTALETTEELFDDLVGADLKGAFFLAQYAAKAMIEAGNGGRIVNLLSVDAFKPMGFLAVYASAKAGLWAATQNLAKELAPHHILVNAVTPGSTITQERIDALQSGTFGAGLLPEQATATRKMIEQNVKAGSFAEQLTKLMPMGRPGWPDEIAKAVLFLVSDLGSYVNGVNIVVDGAQSLR